MFHVKHIFRIVEILWDLWNFFSFGEGHKIYLFHVKHEIFKK